METKYPNFIDGEVLKAARLNEMVKYLDGQTKLSRSELMGYGIVEKLSYQYDKNTNTLKIDSGKAITSNGSLIEIEDGGISYGLFQHKTDSTYLFSTEDVLDGYTRNVCIDMSLYVFALEIYEEKQNHKCNQKSCDINHSDIIQKIRPVLIEKKKVQKTCHYLLPIHVDLNLKKLTNIHTSLNYRTLMNQIHSVFENNQKMIIKGMLSVLNTLGVVSKRNYLLDSAESIYTFDTVIPEWKSKANRFLLAVNKISKLNQRGNGCIVVPPYYLSFFEDMKKALLEFVVFYNEYAAKYKRSIGNGMPCRDNAIVLGQNLNFDENDVYRQFYREIMPDKQYESECKILDQLFTRILCMSESFIMTKYNREEGTSSVKVIPMSFCQKLGDKVIPFYYDVKNCEILKYWQAHLLADANRSTVSSYESFDVSKAPYIYSMENLISYSIQGGYYKNTAEVASSVKNIISKYDLPIKVRIKKIPNIGLSKENYDLLKGYTSSSSKVLANVAKFDITSHKGYKTESRFEKVKHQNEKEETMQTKKQVMNILQMGDVSNIIDTVYNKMPLSTSKLGELRTSLTALSPHKLKMFYKYAYDYSIENRFSPLRQNVSKYKKYFWAIKPVKSVSQIRDYILMSYDKEFKYAELGDVRKFGEIVLVSYKSKLVMDFYVPMNGMSE